MLFEDYDIYSDKCGIYLILNKINGKVYVGQTSEKFKRRFWHHQWCLCNGCHSNKYLQKSWDKYGENSFIFKVLHVFTNEENLDELEIKYISDYNATDMKFGYNMQSGGQPKKLCNFRNRESYKISGEKNRQHLLGRKLSEETKAKMRKSSKHLSPSTENRKALSHYMSNRIVSDETKEKLKAANLGENSPVTNFTIKDVIEIKMSLITGELSIKELSKKFNVSYSCISAIKNNRSWKHVYVDGWEEYTK